jgi:transcription termination factor Rho
MTNEDGHIESSDSHVTGVFEAGKRGRGALRDPDASYRPQPGDPLVSAKLVQEYGLVTGASVSGQTGPRKGGSELQTVESICGCSPEEFAQRTRFEQLTAIDPNQRFLLGDAGNASMRIVDLVAPIGKGTRGVIAAPPKSGKTRLLSQIADGIYAENPDTRVIILLVDERPEEVTQFRRETQAEVLASSSDQSMDEHIALAELTLAHVRCELECGNDVVVLVDSLSRMSRAFNLRGKGAGRTLTGGVDAAALEIPRRFFGLARNIENGGSVTVIGTVLIETGSAMDDVVYEEFKSTGNSEIVLDRSLAEERIYPALNVLASGTRRDELLYGDEEMERLTKLRRWLAGGTPKAAVNGLLKLIDSTDTNEELLARIRV